MRLSGAAIVAGLVGRPIAGSLSPALHNAWLGAAGLDAVYVPFEIAHETALVALITGLRGGGSVRGLNVTAPFKEAALALADRAGLAARSAGAANLLLFEPDGSVTARNTDGLGLLYALKAQANLSVQGLTTTLLGAGGAAQSAAATLLAGGAAEVRIVNRTAERASALSARLGARATAWAWADLEHALAGSHLLINATTLGREGGEPLQVPLQALPGGAVVMDMNYRPLLTALLTEAAARGLPTVDGLAMLVGQAIPTFEALFGRPPPSKVDSRAVALEAMR